MMSLMDHQFQVTTKDSGSRSENTILNLKRGVQAGYSTRIHVGETQAATCPILPALVTVKADEIQATEKSSYCLRYIAAASPRELTFNFCRI